MADVKSPTFDDKESSIISEDEDELFQCTGSNVSPLYEDNVAIQNSQIQKYTKKINASLKKDPRELPDPEENQNVKAELTKFRDRQKIVGTIFNFKAPPKRTFTQTVNK